MIQRGLGTPGPQLRPDGHTYRWVGWSQGGAESQLIHTPIDDATYTATFGCDVLVEVPEVRVEPREDGRIRVSWQPVVDPCLAPSFVYRVYASSTARPVGDPANFPTDPQFRSVGVVNGLGMTFTPRAEDRYFLVVANGTDGLEGVLGHYGR